MSIDQPQPDPGLGTAIIHQPRVSENQSLVPIDSRWMIVRLRVPSESIPVHFDSSRPNCTVIDGTGTVGIGLNLRDSELISRTETFFFKAVTRDH